MMILTLEEQKEIIGFIEYIAENWQLDGITINNICRKLKVSYKEYRMCMNLAMPTLRMKSERDKYKHMYATLKNKLERLGYYDNDVETEEKEGE